MLDDVYEIQFLGDPDLDVADDVYEIQFLGESDLDVR